MILLLDFDDVRALSVNLIVMRKQYKKLFKRSYSDRREVLMQSYDYVLETVGEWLREENRPLETHVDKKYELYLDKEDAELLIEVLRSYTMRLEEMEKETKRKIDGTEHLKELCERASDVYRRFYV